MTTKTGAIALAFTLIASASSAQFVPLKDVPPDPKIASLAQSLAKMHESFKSLVILRGGKCAEPSILEARNPERAHLFCADGYAYTMHKIGDQTKLLRFDPNGPL
jgi:hypothetical protein